MKIELLCRVHDNYTNLRKWDGDVLVAGLHADDDGLWGSEEIKVDQVVELDLDDLSAFPTPVQIKLTQLGADLAARKLGGEANPKVVEPFAEGPEGRRGLRLDIESLPPPIRADVKDRTKVAATIPHRQAKSLLKRRRTDPTVFEIIDTAFNRLELDLQRRGTSLAEVRQWRSEGKTRQEIQTLVDAKADKILTDEEQDAAVANRRQQGDI